MDRRLTAYVLKYLLEHRFESKAEMARQLGMRQRAIEKVFANLDVAKAGTIAFDKAIYYCAENHISLDSILESFIEEMKDGVATNETNQQAFNKLRMTKPLSLTTDGEEVYASMLLFLRKASAHACPVCKTWCNPWDGKRYADQIDCFIGHMAREIIKDISEFYTQEGEHHDSH